MKNKKIKINSQIISVSLSDNEDDYISLTDIAKFKKRERSDYIIQNWLRNRNTIEFLGIWEKINNQNFKPIEFDGFKKQAGLNSFSLTPIKWIREVNAIGMINKSGRYGGGTFAHKDIAFEFATWISPEFKWYLIKEFQRLKSEENKKLSVNWDVKRMLTKINYKIHTDAIKESIVTPMKLSDREIIKTYANEADVLNVALFGISAAEWKSKNKSKSGNMRDYADVSQLVCLANLESLNAEFIKTGLSQKERLVKLNETAIWQIRSLLGNNGVSRLI